MVWSLRRNTRPAPADVTTIRLCVLGCFSFGVRRFLRRFRFSALVFVGRGEKEKPKAAKEPPHSIEKQTKTARPPSRKEGRAALDSRRPSIDRVGVDLHRHLVVGLQV